MAVTVTRAAERSVRRERERASRFEVGDAVLVAIACFVALTVALAYAGRLAALEHAFRPRADAPIDLNSVERADLLEPGLTTAFSNPDDRQFAAREWWTMLASERSAGHMIENVGAAARLTASASAIHRNPRLDVFARRLAAARDSAAAGGRPWPDTVPLFTASDVAAMKPSFVVRTRAQFQSQLVLWCTLYILAFQLVAAIWRARAVDGDRLLLAAAHLVTGLGFAMLVSRADPLRDVPLFVRYAEGVLVGIGMMTALSMIDFGRAAMLELSYLPLLGAIGLCSLLIVFGSGPGRSGAKVNLGPVQPIEAIRLLLACFLAGYFARRWELLRGLRSRAIRGVRVPAWIDLPRARVRAAGRGWRLGGARAVRAAKGSRARA